MRGESPLIAVIHAAGHDRARRTRLGSSEAAKALGIAVPTARQWWAYARAWLKVEMRGVAPR